MCAHCCELGMEKCRSVSTPMSVTVEKDGDRSERPEVSAELATSRIDWIWEWRQLSSPKPWQFQERVTMNVSNVLRDTFMVILVT